MLFFGFHWSFTIMEPSGKGWSLPGTPALNALIMVGLPTITLSTWSFSKPYQPAPRTIAIKLSSMEFLVCRTLAGCAP